MGSGYSFGGEKGKRGRSAIMRVVNNHLKFDGKQLPATRNCCIFVSNKPSYPTMIVITGPGHAVTQETWEERTGLLSALIPQAGGSSTSTSDPMAFNASKGELKLGPAPISEELRQETERVLREQAMMDRDPSAQYDVHYARPQPPPGVTSPSTSDLLPHPPNYKTVDVKREVEKVRDARKRIRLEPSLLSTAGVSSSQQASVRSRALPSVCAYTLHDVGEG